MKTKRLEAYNLEALKYLKKHVQQVRLRLDDAGKIPEMMVNLKGLEEAVKALPKTDKENIEQFWGLNGGTNHSKRLLSTRPKDKAYIAMYNKARKSMRELFVLDYVKRYDDNLNLLIRQIIRKVDKEGVTGISDFEVMKYLLVFFIYIWNGPKMSFEDDFMSVDTRCAGDSICDEYVMLQYIWLILNEYPDNSVNLQLIMDWLEMLDYQDMLMIKKSLNIELPEECNSKQIQKLRTYTEIREFKEKIFAYGAWDITTELIVGNPTNLELFVKELNKIRRNWSRIRDYKVYERKLKTINELRFLEVYNIGELEFTDPYEVMFLYLERNLIESKR